jgi:hypothetical protein
MDSKKSKIVAALVLVFMVLHNDFWLWDDKSLVFGFMPVGLAFHTGYSLFIAFFWFLVIKFAWPSQMEKWADEKNEPKDGGQK